MRRRLLATLAGLALAGAAALPPAQVPAQVLSQAPTLDSFVDSDRIRIPLPGAAPAEDPAPAAGTLSRSASPPPVSAADAPQPAVIPPGSLLPDSPAPPSTRAAAPVAEGPQTALPPQADETADPPEVAAPAAEAEPPPAAEPPAPPPTPTLRIALDPGGDARGADLLLQGEEASVTLRAPFPAGAVIGASRLEIVYRNGADLLPEQSMLRVSGEGVPPATVEPSAFGAAAVWSVPVLAPADGVGQVVVDLEARQAHRLLCGPQASYELWTAIDLARSALVVELLSPIVPATVEEGLATLSLAAAAGQTVTLVPAVAPDDAEALVPLVAAAQAIGLRTGGMPLEVAPAGRMPPTPLSRTISPPVVVVGPIEAVAAMLPSAVPASVTGPTLGLASTGAGNVPVLVVTGRNAAETATAASRLSGMDRADELPLLTEGGRHSLAALGYGDRDVRAHRERIDVDFRLPDDLYAADGSNVRFRLDAAYAPGLAANAGLTLTVNGIATGVLRLADPAGELIEGREIDLPYRLFRPGMNRIGLELAIPVATPDRPCPPLTALDDPLFTLFASSSLDLPGLARLRELPNLRLFAEAGIPYAVEDPVDLVLPVRDADSLSAAVTILGRLAAAAGRPIAFEPRTGWSRGGGRHVLVVAPAEAVSDEMLGQGELRRRDILAALPVLSALTTDTEGPTIDDLVARMAAERRAAAPAIPGADTGAAVPVAPDASALRRSSWEDRLAAADQPGWWDRWFDRARGAVAELTGRVTDRTGGPTGPQWLADLPGAPQGLIVQFPSAAGDGTATILVTAADPASLKAAADLLVSPAVWPALSGGVAAFGGELSATMSHTPSQSWTVLPRPLDLRNVALLAGHWLSRHTAVWLLLILGTAVVAAIVSRLLLRRIGVRDGG